ncbi:RidA family protein [Arthrobacter sp. CJ23]|uniref:RidA family protein n=1 Tax=Arthrobacter sp. CJ23 TaxID=2972479 RepID=UPI00215C3FAD|nr:RidA family protein [Arthrobacter sp. CJ23]UVJ40146.1 RidA family protein [Arthrobacter sp. CJ23]
MTRATIIRTSHAPSLPVLSQATATEHLLFTSGQVGLDPATGAVPETFAAEVEQALDNLEAVLAAGDCAPEDVVRTFCVLTDAADLPEFNRLYTQRFPDAKPARTTIVAGLVGPFRFEIEATALRAAP